MKTHPDSTPRLLCCALMIGAAAAGSCRTSAAPTPPHAPQTPATPAVAAETPDVRFVPEMEPLPGVSEAPLAVTPGVRAAFDAEWRRVQAAVATRVTPAELAGISRWARAETQNAALTAGWISTLSMEPIGREGAFAVFGQRPETSSVELPSHSPLVRRRLIVAPVFDPATRTIPIVFITIRGWAEE